MSPAKDGAVGDLRVASDVAFTPDVKAVQSRKGSRRAYAHMEEGAGWSTVVTPELREFVEAQTSAFLATANARGQPYVQHRGGPPGFLRVLDERTIAFADFSGNRQFISTGNLLENPKVHLFLIDYETQRRAKIWGEARVVENDHDLIARLMPPACKARSDQAIVLTVAAWDANCPQHIPHLVPADEVERTLLERDRRIASLEREVRELKAAA